MRTQVEPKIQQARLTGNRRASSFGIGAWRGAVIAALAGGSLFTSCTGRVWASVIDGTRNYTLSLLDPQIFLDLFLDDTTDPASTP